MSFDNYLLGIFSVLISLLGSVKQIHAKVDILTVEDLSLVIKDENIIKKVMAFLSFVGLRIQSLDSVPQCVQHVQLLSLHCSSV
jgi:hypothetical protein